MVFRGEIYRICASLSQPPRHFVSSIGHRRSLQTMLYVGTANRSVCPNSSTLGSSARRFEIDAARRGRRFGDGDWFGEEQGEEERKQGFICKFAWTMRRLSEKTHMPASYPLDYDWMVYISRVHECINLGGCIGYIAYVCMYLLLNILKTIWIAWRKTS